MQINGILMAVEDRIAAIGSEMEDIPLEYLVDELHDFNMPGVAAEILEASKTKADLHGILMEVLPGKSPDEQRTLMDAVECCVAIINLH